MDILGKLFGSTARVKVLRLFVFNERTQFTADLVARRAKIAPTTARREIRALEQSGLVRKRAATRGGPRFRLEASFPHLAPLRYFLANTAALDDQDILGKLRAARGKLALVIVAGMFIQDADSRIDLLVVGDGLKERALAGAVKDIEAELGKEIRLAVFTRKDFEYRHSMYDKLIRDILDYPHRTLLDRIGVEK